MLPVHTATRTWVWTDDKEVTISYDFLEQVLNLQAIEEGVITEKERLRIIQVDCNDQVKKLLIKTEVYNLLQH